MTFPAIRPNLLAAALLTLGVACAPTAVAPTAPPTSAAKAPTAAPAKPAAVASPAAKVAASPAASPVAAPSPSPAAKPAASPAASFDERAVADFYRGKTVRFIVGFSPGGAFDVYSRMLARHMPQYLPGNPNMIVENRPGGGRIVAANAIYKTEPKDGTAIGSFNEFLVLQQLLGNTPAIEFDVTKFNWLGNSVDTFTGCMVRTDVGIQSIQDVIGGREMVVGTTGLGAATHDVPAVLNEALGTKFKLVPGYPGIANIQLAMENKEVDGYCVSFDAMTIVGRTSLESGDAKVLLAMGASVPDHPFLKGVPAAESLAKTEDAKVLLRAIHAPSQMSKPFAVAPEVPRDRVEALRKAMAAAFASPAFIEDAKKAKLEGSSRGGEEVTRIVQGVMGSPAPIVGKLKQILTP